MLWTVLIACLTRAGNRSLKRNLGEMTAQIDLRFDEINAKIDYLRAGVADIREKMLDMRIDARELQNRVESTLQSAGAEEAHPRG